MSFKRTSLATTAITIAALFASTTTATAVSTITSTITTSPADALGQHFGSCTNPAGTIMAIPANRASQILFVNKSTNTVTTVSDPTYGITRPIGCAFSPDGTKLYSYLNGQNGQGDNGVVIVDVATAIATGYVAFPYYIYPRSVAVTPDGKKLLIASNDNALTAYNISDAVSPKTNLNLGGSNSSADTALIAWQNTTIQTASDATMFFTSETSMTLASSTGVIEQFDLTNGTSQVIVGSTTTPTETEVHARGWCENADHSLFATSTGSINPGKVIVINATTGATVASHTFSNTTANGQLNNCQFTPTGDLLFTGTPDSSSNSLPGEIYVLDKTNLNLLETISTPNVNNLKGLHLFSDGTLYAAGNYNNIAVIQLDSKYLSDDNSGGTPSVTKKNKTAKAAVIFAAKKSTLTAAGKKSLNTVASKYKKSASKIVLTVSAPSNTKKAKDTKAAKKLATKRANAIKAYLKKKGVKAKVTVKIAIVVTKGKKMTAKLKKSVETSNLVITYKG